MVVNITQIINNFKNRNQETSDKILAQLKDQIEPDTDKLLNQWASKLFKNVREAINDD